MSHTQALKHSHLKRLNGTVVLKPHGDLTGGPETDELETLVDQLDVEGVKCLVINLTAVAIMNSLALSRIIRAHLKFTKRGARVLLCNLENRIEAVFVIAKLSMLFPVYPNETAAIAAADGPPEP
jgi:anti-anti-sigma factor